MNALGRDGVYVNETLPRQALGRGTYTNETATAIATFRISVVSDTAIGNWTDWDGGTTALYSRVNETLADERNGSYVQSGVGPSGDILKLAFEAVPDPGIHSDHVLRYRFYAPDDEVVVRLVEDTTTIAEWTHTAGTVVEYTTFESTLSTAEAESITDYSDLHFEIEAG